MIPERMLELLILKEVIEDYDKDFEYRNFLNNNFDFKKLNNRYLELGREFLTDYALNNTEKSD